MPAFDPLNPHSPGGGAIYGTSLLVADCEAFWRVSEAANAVEAIEHVVVGFSKDLPWDGSQFTREQIDELFCQAHLYPPDEDDDAISSAAKSMVNPYESGNFILTVRRVARDSEIRDAVGRNGLYLWFFDEMEALRNEMMTKSMARACPRLRYVRRLGAPAYAALENEVSQGAYLWCDFLVAWGDSIG